MRRNKKGQFISESQATPEVGQYYPNILGNFDLNNCINGIKILIKLLCLIIIIGPWLGYILDKELIKKLINFYIKTYHTIFANECNCNTTNSNVIKKDDF